MTEFVLGNRRLRLYPDGKITSRAFNRGKETKKDTWRVISFKNHIGYFKCEITVDGISRSFAKHRLIYLALFSSSHIILSGIYLIIVKIII